MRVRSLDGGGDWNFGHSQTDYIIGNDAIGQNIATRLRSFLGDCFFDTAAGVDWLNLLEIGRQTDLRRSIQSTIIATSGVTAINSFDFFVNEKRELTINYNISTIYSPSFEGSLNA